MTLQPHWKRLLLPLVILTLATAPPLPAGAVIIDSGDGTGNVNPPGSEPDDTITSDPGWAYVGSVNGLSGVYLRNRWVLTANHVGPGAIELEGVSYDYIAGSAVRLTNGDGTHPDLIVFGIATDPGLPELPIRSNTSSPNGDVVLIGYGRDRGVATDSDDPDIWQPPPDPPDPPIPGWWWGVLLSKRWGVNRVAGPWPGTPNNTVSFYTVFDYPTALGHVDDEAQAAYGDSGGAVFAQQGKSWELAGIMLFNGLHEGHLNGSVLRDELTGAADLSNYRQQILDLTAVPEPSGSAMLSAGAALLAVLDRRRGRH